MTRTRNVVVAFTGLALAAACSSAPAPQSLTQNGGTTGGTQAPGTTGGLSTGTSGVAPGTPGGSTGGSGSTGSSGSATTGSGGSTGTSGGSGSSSGTAGGASGGTSGGFASSLFTPAEDHIGITPTSINLCAHAALTYGAAFGTKDTDFNVFWEAINKEKGGIYGRQVNVSYENDNYSPDTAVTAAQTCADKGIFMLLGGIGFDQIPAVRRWAEVHRMLYLHHTATVEGSKGLRFSFTELPTVERMGEGFGQLYLSKFKGKKVGIIERDSPNWRPGANNFKAMLKAAGITPVADQYVADKKANYTQDILAVKDADVVFLWENALNGLEYLRQANAQGLHPNYLLFPFNLVSQTMGTEGEVSPPYDGVAMYPAYSYGDYSGSFARYADDVKLFEAQYAKYDNGIDLKSVGGDLLFLNWVGQKALYEQFLACGKDCTRNKFVSVLQGYHRVPTSSACLIDFTRGDGQHGSEAVNFMQTYNSPSGKVNWRNSRACVMP